MDIIEFTEESEYNPKYTKDEFVEKSKPIFALIIDAYSHSHHMSYDEEEVSTFDHEEFTKLMEDIMFESTDFLDLMGAKIIEK